MLVAEDTVHETQVLHQTQVNHEVLQKASVHHLYPVTQTTDLYGSIAFWIE